MILGILGDTHGRVPAMAAAVKLLQSAGAEYFIHTGDVGSTGVIDHLAGLPSAFVFGNNDWDRMELSRYADKLGVQCFGNHADLTLAGKRIAAIHGDDYRLKKKLLDSQQLDYLFHGHTHIRNDEMFGRTRIINPGALHRAVPKTVATLNTVTDALKFHIVPTE